MSETNSRWTGMLKVLEIQHVRGGKVTWEDRTDNNLLHDGGEEYFLQCLFENDGSLLPTSYYVGLDARSELANADTMDDLVDEPASNGYIRQTLGIDGGWSVTLVSGVYRAIGQILTFSATGGDWGPVTKMFLTNESDDSGVLISSVPLSSTLTVEDGDSVNMRMSMSLRDYPL